MRTMYNPYFQAPDRRIMILEISPSLAFDCILGPRLGEGNILWVPKIEGLPEDAKIEAVFYQPESDMLQVRIWSSTFTAMEEGYTVPRIHLRVSAHRVDLTAEQALPLLPLRQGMEKR